MGLMKGFPEGDRIPFTSGKEQVILSVCLVPDAEPYFNPDARARPK
jgi:hypothetical protein